MKLFELRRHKHKTQRPLDVAAVGIERNSELEMALSLALNLANECTNIRFQLATGMPNLPA